ncbi:exo-alpha-sialidase [Bacteroidales bacterium OttesenSCG-928-B11]|nr:exo-alpha-sialidase [Bacteroidales bacterium OttesenSCG-928-C03]MDL2312746.1 exo-alpha-sialidase [Bacteroidales bacterium OttesenSCG-928-B11]
MKRMAGRINNSAVVSVLFIFLLFSFQSSKGQVDENADVFYRQGVVVDQFIYNNAPFPSVHSPTIAETPEGLVAAFFGGEYEGHPEVSIYVSRLSDSTWSAPVKVVDGRVNDTLRKACYNPVLFQLPGRELLLFYKVGFHVQDWSGYLIRSFDHGKTWSHPEPLPEGFLGPVKNAPLLLNDVLLCGSSTENDGWKVHFEYFNLKDKHWSKKMPINDTTWGIIQPAILSLRDGRLQMLCRSMNEAIVTSFSSDGGKHWTQPTAINLPNNNSGIAAITLQNGHHLLVYNHVKTKESAWQELKRTPLNVAVSEDGLRWNASLILEDSPIGEYSYPFVMQGTDGYVHVVYTWRREKIKYVKIDPVLLNKKEMKDGVWPANGK